MKTLIVYDSVYGNTEKIARAIGDAIAGEVKILRVSDLIPSEFNAFDMLIIGSPTHGGRPTQSIQSFFKEVPHSAFKSARATVFRYQTFDETGRNFRLCRRKNRS
jgi:flavodoxin I